MLFELKKTLRERVENAATHDYIIRLLERKNDTKGTKNKKIKKNPSFGAEDLSLKINGKLY